MKCTRHVRYAACQGFTLIESIIVLVILGIAAAAIVSLQGSIFNGQSNGRDMQVGVQLMQECTEQLLATRRGSGGYSASALADSTAATASCNAMTLTGYSAPTVTTLTSGNSTTAGMTACPYATGTNCKLVSITQGGLTPVTLMLVSY